MACKDGKHKFLPRYEFIYSTTILDLATLCAKQGVVFDSSGLPWQAGNSYLKEKRYIHDVCVKCGEVIKRSDNHGH